MTITTAADRMADAPQRGREDASTRRRIARTMLAALLGATLAVADGPLRAQAPPPPPPETPAPVSPAPPPVASPAPPVPPAPVPEAHRCDGWSQRPVFKLGQHLHVGASDVFREAVVVFGTVVVDGAVCRDLVVVFGDVELTSTAYVGDALSVIGGRLRVAPGAVVDGDMVVVGGTADVPASFRPGREQVLIGIPFVGDRIASVLPWVTRGLLYGRLIVPDVAWNWWVVGITLFLVVVLNLLFLRSTTRATAAIEARPLSAFAAGLLVLLLSGPVMTLLAVSVIGAVVVPFVMLAMGAAWVMGSIAVARWIGARLVPVSGEEDRGEATRSLLIGFVVKVIAYMIPVVGIAVWALAGVLGLGAATLALVSSFREENPRREPPAVPPAPPVAPPPLPDAANGAFAGPASLPLAGDDLRLLPRGGFLERLGAFVIDVVLVALVNGVMDLTDRDGAFFLLLLTYHVAFWAWKGTTIGGMVAQLRLVRIDGAVVTFSDALVRGLMGVLSLAALGIGCLWMLRDEQRQTWHDIVAGTLVVRVPRGVPLP